MSREISVVFTLAAMIVLASAAFSQGGSAEQIHAADNAIVEKLRTGGVKFETKRAILWVEKDGLSQKEIEDFGALVNQGIVDTEKYTGIKFDKKYYRADKMEYFISKGGISRGSTDDRPYIFLPVARVKDKSVPYLHETTHKLAYKSLESLWLAEGYATFVQTYVAGRYGGYDANPLNAEKADIDQLAKDVLKTDLSKRLLPLVGLNGFPGKMSPGPALEVYRPIFEDRRVTAKAFYNLSTSFVKFLVAKVGIKKLEKAFTSADTRGNIMAVTGRSVDDWKSEWLKSLAT